VLRARLYCQIEMEKARSSAGQGAQTAGWYGDRSEKIRTYNSENRLTDHRTRGGDDPPLDDVDGMGRLQNRDRRNDIAFRAERLKARTAPHA